MRDHGIWRSRLALWLPAVIFLIVNLAALLAYRTFYAGEVRDLDQRLAAQEETLVKLSRGRQQSDDLLALAAASRHGIELLHEERFSTERERLTAMITEVKTLARRAGLEPTAINYPDEVFEDFGLRQRALAFGVQGSYRQLRQFVNLLELSDSFLTLEEVRLADGPGGDRRLRISLRVKTFFSTVQDAIKDEASAERASS